MAAASLVVAGEHDGCDALRLQGLESLEGILARLVAHRDQPGGRVVDEEHGHSLALALQRRHAGLGLRAE